jgi:hypothetical protein
MKRSAPSAGNAPINHADDRDKSALSKMTFMTNHWRAVSLTIKRCARFQKRKI